MKSIIVSLVLLSSSIGFSSLSGDIPKGTVRTSILQGQLLDIRVTTGDCPPNALCVPVTLARIGYTLGGCFDRLGPVTAEVNWDEKTNKYLVSASAINFVNSKSASINCLRMPEAVVEVVVGPGFIGKDQVEFSSLGSDRVFSTKEF